MNIENLSFATVSDFKEWKYDLEENMSCTYYKPRGTKQMKGSKVDSYKCNRSGNYKNKPLGKRRTKSSGKLQNNCTSTVQVEVCNTHYGHNINLEHIKLNKRQRHVISAKLSQGVTREKILDDIRDEGGYDCRRIHLLDKKDLSNIKKSYIESTSRHDNDQQSVLAWIEEWQSAEYNPILHYNLQGQKPEYSCMRAEDFMIVLQTESQIGIFQKFGLNGVLC